MSDKTCTVMKSFTGDLYAVTKTFKDGSTSNRYKYKIENWHEVKSAVLEDILVPLGVEPALWSKFLNGKAKITEINS